MATTLFCRWEKEAEIAWIIGPGVEQMRFCSYLQAPEPVLSVLMSLSFIAAGDQEELDNTTRVW